MSARVFQVRKRPLARGAKAQPKLPGTTSWWKDFYKVVRRIPAGRVTTYGAVAALAGHPRAARHVGFALAALKETGANADVPWQRVLGSRPRNRAAITIKDPVGGALQRMLLEAEGVRFDARGNVELTDFGWFGKTKTAAAKGATRKKPSPAPSPRPQKPTRRMPL